MAPRFGSVSHTKSVDQISAEMVKDLDRRDFNDTVFDPSIIEKDKNKVITYVGVFK